MHKYRYEVKDAWSQWDPDRTMVDIYEDDEFVASFYAHGDDAIGYIEDSEIDAMVEARKTGKGAVHIVLTRVLRKARNRQRTEYRAVARLQRREAKRVMRKYGI